MESALTAEDLEPLNDLQREAVLTAIYTALIADGKPHPDEVAAFKDAIEGLPWGKPVTELRPKMVALEARLATATRDDKIAFLTETSANVPVALRVGVVETMIVIAAADNVLSRGEKGSIVAFIRAFGLSDLQVELLRAKYESSVKGSPTEATTEGSTSTPEAGSTSTPETGSKSTP